MQKITIYEEKVLLSNVVQGDENAFQSLFNLYRDKIYYFSRKLMQADDKAEDVLQEIFLKIWMNREKLPHVENFKAYVYTLTRNHIYNALRKQANEELLILRLSSDQKGKTSPAQAFDNLSLNELHHALQKAITTLTPYQKRVFELSRIEGLNHHEIAGQLGISTNTVKKHISDALRTIRAQLRPQEFLKLLAFCFLLSHF